MRKRLQGFAKWIQNLTSAPSVPATVAGALIQKSQSSNLMLAWPAAMIMRASTLGIMQCQHQMAITDTYLHCYPVQRTLAVLARSHQQDCMGTFALQSLPSALCCSSSEGNGKERGEGPG